MIGFVDQLHQCVNVKGPIIENVTWVLVLAEMHYPLQTVDLSLYRFVDHQVGEKLFSFLFNKRGKLFFIKKALQFCIRAKKKSMVEILYIRICPSLSI